MKHGIYHAKFTAKSPQFYISSIIGIHGFRCWNPWIPIILGWGLLFSPTLLFAQQDLAAETVKEDTGNTAERDSRTVAALPEDYELEEMRSILLDNGKPVLIRAIDISVRGLSNKKILVNRIGVKIGDEFANLSELRKVLDLHFDKLRSTGYFKSEIGIKYRLIAEEGSVEQQLIRLEAEFQDAWTVYPLPLPYYGTAEGFGVKGRLKWDNFLGLLTNVTFRADVIQVRNGNYGWDLTGGVNVSTIKITPNFGINASMYVARDAGVDGANWSIGVGAGLSFDIPLLEAHGIGMDYSVSNSSSATFGYVGVQTSHPYFSTSFSHSFGWGKERSSWGAVMRDGYYMSVSNSYGIDSDPGTLSGLRALALESVNVDFSMRISRSYRNMVNFKGRVGLGKSFDFANGIYDPHGYNYDVSSYNRGKREDAVTGKFITYLNMDMAVLVFSDALLGDVLLEPFLDVTWVSNANGFKLEDASLGSGFELIWIFHSLKFSFTYGIDLQQPELYTIGITTGFYF